MIADEIMVEVNVQDGVARVFLNRPEKANALHSALLEELRFRIESCSKDNSVRVMVLAGRGKTFCGGADVTELSGLTASNAGEFVEKIHRCCQAIRELPVPWSRSCTAR